MNLKTIIFARPALAVLVMSLSGFAIAMVSQIAWGLQPCAWCVLQRLILLATAGLAATALLPFGKALSTLSLAAAGLASLAGFSAAAWQWGYASKMPSCVQTLADRIIMWTNLDLAVPLVFEPKASCSQASLPLWGLPYPAWAVALFLGMALIVAYSAVAHLTARRR